MSYDMTAKAARRRIVDGLQARLDAAEKRGGIELHVKLSELRVVLRIATAALDALDSATLPVGGAR